MKAFSLLQPPKQKPKAPQKNTKQQPKKSAKPAGSGKAKKKVSLNIIMFRASLSNSMARNLGWLVRVLRGCFRQLWMAIPFGIPINAQQKCLCKLEQQAGDITIPNTLSVPLSSPKLRCVALRACMII